MVEIVPTGLSQLMVDQLSLIVLTPYTGLKRILEKLPAEG